MECIIELAAAKLSPEDIMQLDEMIDNEASVEELDTRLEGKIENYDNYIQQVIEMVKDYLSDEDEEEEEPEALLEQIA